MAVYFIANITVTDPDGYKDYVAQVPAIIAAHGGRYLVRGGEHETIEGDWTPDRMVVLEFDSMEAAKGWYHSPEYQAILPLRLNNSTGSSVLIEGCVPPGP